jgi:hypothetical protein
LTDFPGRFAALRRALRSSRARAALVALAFAVLSGCGKKGPPLAPYSSSPGAPAEVTIRRKGDQVEIHFKVPVANKDGRRPAKIDHVEVYALTMPAETIHGDKEGKEGKGGKGGKGRKGGHGSSGSPGGGPGAGGQAAGAGHELPFRKYGTVVGSVLVRKPPPKPKEPKEGEPPPPPPPPRTDPGLDQGDFAVIVDTLTAASLTPVEIPEKERAGSHPHEDDHEHEAPEEKSGKNALRALVTPPELGPPLPLPSLRYYSLAGTNGKKEGVFAPPIAVPLEDLPPTPPTPTVTVAEGKIQVAMVKPDGLRKAVLPLTPSPIPGSAAPAGDAATAGTPATTPAAQAAPGAAPATAAVPSVPAAATPPPTGSAATPSAPGAAKPADDDQLAVPCTPAPAAPAPATPSPDGTPAPSVAPVPGAPTASAPASVAPVQAADTPKAGVQAAPGDKPAPPPCVPAPTTLLPAKLISTYPPPVYGFMVYEMAPAAFTAPKQEPGAVPPYPLLLTPAPVPAGTWNDSRFVVGVDRCYSVRLAMTVGLITSESAGTPTVCVTTVDTFPPAAPKNLQAVASEGTISLIWDANTEDDLAGYIVLRGAAGSDKLTAITPTPIKETTFRDTKIRAGVRYAYVVVAVDTATPQNVSAQSNRVEETAR